MKIFITGITGFVGAHLARALVEDGAEVEVAPTALEMARTAVRVAPDEPRAHHVLGLALLASGATAEAERELSIAHRLAPDDPRFAADLERVRGGGGQ